jgi:hypothetical protein
MEEDSPLNKPPPQNNANPRPSIKSALKKQPDSSPAKTPSFKKAPPKAVEKSEELLFDKLGEK